MLLLSTFALAAPPLSEQAAIASLVAQGHEFRVPAPPPEGVTPGANLLTVSKAGDLVILQDTEGEWFAELLSRGADLDWALNSVYGAFYQDFDDEYQYLCILLVRDFGMFGAFYSPMANDVTGIGYQNVTNVETFDTTDTQVEGMIFMNYVGYWAEYPEVGRYVFGQEFMHRWGSFVEMDVDGVEPDALLGRDLAHWSFWMDTPNSPMEGNRWVDNGDGTWSTDAGSGSTHSMLDLYLMGLAGAEEVEAQTLLVPDPAPEGYDATTTPVYLSGGQDLTVQATPVRFGLDAIVAAEGERSPTVDESPKTFRMAFLVLALQGDDLSEGTLAMVDGVRTTFEADWEADVLGRADLDTTLGATTAPTFGEADDTGDTGAGEDTGDGVAEEAPPEGEATAEGCGCASTPAGAPAATALLAMLAARRRRRA